MPRQIAGTKVYFVDDLAEALDVTRQVILKYRKEGSLRGRKVGGKWIFTEEAVREFLNQEEPPKKGNV